MTIEELSSEISELTKQTLPLICRECYGQGSEREDARQTCPACNGSGLNGFTNGYADNKLIDLAKRFAIEELEKLRRDSHYVFEDIDQAINALQS